ncbi:MAG: GNAT family N-acetyltransferase [Lachnospiraceae bacterium]|nr:GNAT family N-acetyltransferase [Lachnospiraceae bacterium]
MNVFRIQNSPENEIERRLLTQKGVVFFSEENVSAQNPFHMVYSADTPQEYRRLLAEHKSVFGVIPDLCGSYSSDDPLSAPADSWPEGSYLTEQGAEIDDAYLRLVRARCLELPYVTAVGERVYLRELWEADVPEMFWADGSAEEKRELVASYRKHVYLPWTFGIWGIFRKEDDRLLGRAGLEYDCEGEVTLGYEVREEYRRQGYAFEAVCLALECFRQSDPDLAGIRPVVVCISPENLASRALIRKVQEKRIVPLEVRTG